jgi:hypothetical protein
MEPSPALLAAVFLCTVSDMIFLAYLFLIVFTLVSVAIFASGLDVFINTVSGRAPSISTRCKNRDAVVRQIVKEIPNAKTILDIGSGWGAMVKTVARALPNAQVLGIEIMPTPYIYSLFRCLFVRNARFRMGNVFKFLARRDDNFDVGIAYLLTPEMTKVEKLLSRFKVLLAVDFPLPNVKPYKKVKLHRDFFIQHWLYVYRSRNK